ELRAGGRVLPLQPRILNVLIYLARNQERVVPKDELLDAVWPGVIVTDASLQRAISLARSALGEVGASQAIRTYSRQGYRLCADPVSATVAAPALQAVTATAGGAAADPDPTVSVDASGFERVLADAR